jgi:poly-gamma-glutamate synthesis protein (capsule biosynthesis protein)
MTIVAWAAVDGGQVTEIGFLPCRIEPNGHVTPLDPGSPKGAEVVDYVRKCGTSQQLNGRLVPGGPALAGYSTIRVVPDRP